MASDQSGARCPSCETPYDRHPGIAATCGYFQSEIAANTRLRADLARVTKERDELRELVRSLKHIVRSDRDAFEATADVEIALNRFDFAEQQSAASPDSGTAQVVVADGESD